MLHSLVVLVAPVGVTESLWCCLDGGGRRREGLARLCRREERGLLKEEQGGKKEEETKGGVAQLRWGERACADMQHEGKHPLAVTVMQVSSLQHKKAKHTHKKIIALLARSHTQCGAHHASHCLRK